MRPLDEEILYLRKTNFSVTRAIRDRAVEMERLLAEGKLSQATDLAHEVQSLQDFHDERYDLGPRDRPVATRPLAEWAKELLLHEQTNW